MAKYENQVVFNIITTLDKNGILQLQNQLTAVETKITSMMGKGIYSDAALQKDRSRIQQLKQLMMQNFNASTGLFNTQGFTQGLYKANTSIATMGATLKRYGAEGQLANAQLLNGMVKYQTSLKRTTTLASQLKTTMQNTVRWGLTASIFQGAVSALSEAVSYVKELDESLTQITMVSGESRDNMKEFAEYANKAAASLGASTTDYTEAVKVFIQEGFTMEESKTQATQSIKLANVSEQDSATTSDQITAYRNAFNLSIEEMDTSLDKFAKVANETASNVNELMTASQRAASTAASVGASEDSFLATIATIQSVTRESAENIGNGIKSIYTRLADIKTNGSTEGDDGETVEYGQYAQALAAAGVNILDESGTVKSMDQILSELQTVWADLSDTMKLAVGEKVAGRYQYNRFAALMNNEEYYNKAYAATQNSEGAMDEMQEDYMSSLEAMGQQMSTNLESIFTSFYNSGIPEELVGVLTGITDWITNISGAFDDAKPVVLAFVAAIGKLMTTLGGTEALATRISNKRAMRQEKDYNAYTMRETDQYLRGQGVVFNEAMKADPQVQAMITQQAQFSKFQAQGLLNNEEIEAGNQLWERRLEELAKYLENQYAVVEGEQAANLERDLALQQLRQQKQEAEEELTIFDLETQKQEKLNQLKQRETEIDNSVKAKSVSVNTAIQQTSGMNISKRTSEDRHKILIEQENKLLAEQAGREQEILTAQTTITAMKEGNLSVDDNMLKNAQHLIETNEESLFITEKQLQTIQAEINATREKKALEESEALFDKSSIELSNEKKQIEEQITDNKQKQVNLEAEIKTHKNKIASLTKQVENADKRTSATLEKEIGYHGGLLIAQEERLRAAQDEAFILPKKLEYINELLGLYERETDLTRQQNEIQENINKLMGLTGEEALKFLEDIELTIEESEALSKSVNIIKSRFVAINESIEQFNVILGESNGELGQLWNDFKNIKSEIDAINNKTEKTVEEEQRLEFLTKQAANAMEKFQAAFGQGSSSHIQQINTQLEGLKSSISNNTDLMKLFNEALNKLNNSDVSGVNVLIEKLEKLGAESGVSANALNNLKKALSYGASSNFVIQIEESLKTLEQELGKDNETFLKFKNTAEDCFAALSSGEIDTFISKLEELNNLSRENGAAAEYMGQVTAEALQKAKLDSGSLVTQLQLTQEEMSALTGETMRFRESLTKGTRGITDLAMAGMSLTMTVESFKDLGDAITDEDLTTWERMEKLLTSIGMILFSYMMFKPVLEMAKTGLGGVTTAMTANSIAAGKNMAAVEGVSQETTRNAIVADAAMKKRRAYAVALQQGIAPAAANIKAEKAYQEALIENNATLAAGNKQLRDKARAQTIDLAAINAQRKGQQFNTEEWRKADLTLEALVTELKELGLLSAEDAAAALENGAAEEAFAQSIRDADVAIATNNIEVQTNTAEQAANAEATNLNTGAKKGETLAINENNAAQQGSNAKKTYGIVLTEALTAGTIKEAEAEALATATRTKGIKVLKATQLWEGLTSKQRRSAIVSCLLGKTAEEALTIAKLEGASATKALSLAIAESPLVTLLPIILAVAGAVAGIVAVVKSVIDAYEANEEALENANEALNSANELAQATADSYDNLKSKLEELDEYEDTMDGLVKGTQEWNEALISVNETVLELMKNYPVLAQSADYITTNEDGVMSITDEGRQAVLDYQMESMQATQQAAYTAQTIKTQAQLNQNAEDYMDKTNSVFGMSTDATQTELANLIAETTNKAIAEGRQITAEELYNAYQKSNISSTNDTFLTGAISDFQPFVDNMTELISWSNEYSAMQTSKQSTRQQEIQTELQNTFDLADDELSDISTIMVGMTKDVEYAASSLSGDALYEAYAEAMNLDVTKTETEDGTTTFTLADGSTFDMADESMQQILGEMTGIGNLVSEQTEVIRQRLDYANNNLFVDKTNGEELNKDILAGKGVDAIAGTVSTNEAEAYEQEWKSTFYNGEEVNTSVVSTFFGDDEDFYKSSGAEGDTLEELQTSFIENLTVGFEDVPQKIQEVVDNSVEAIQTAYNTDEELRNISQGQMSSLNDFIEDNGLNNIETNSLINAITAIGDDGDKIATLFSGLSSLDIDDLSSIENFKDLLEDAGIDLSTIGLDNFVSAAENSAITANILSQSLNEVTESAKSLKEILDDLSFGEAIDEDKYNDLVNTLGEEAVKDLFTFVSGIGYIFKGTEEELESLYNNYLNKSTNLQTGYAYDTVDYSNNTVKSGEVSGDTYNKNNTVTSETTVKDLVGDALTIDSSGNEFFEYTNADGEKIVANKYSTQRTAEQFGTESLAETTVAEAQAYLDKNIDENDSQYTETEKEAIKTAKLIAQEIVDKSSANKAAKSNSAEEGETLSYEEGTLSTAIANDVTAKANGAEEVSINGTSYNVKEVQGYKQDISDYNTKYGSLTDDEKALLAASDAEYRAAKEKYDNATKALDQVKTDMAAEQTVGKENAGKLAQDYTQRLEQSDYEDLHELLYEYNEETGKFELRDKEDRQELLKEYKGENAEEIRSAFGSATDDEIDSAMGNYEENREAYLTAHAGELAEEYDVETESITNLTEQLEEQNPELKENEELVQELAAQQIAAEDAADELADSMDDYNDIITENNRSTSKWANAMSDIKSKLGKILGLDLSDLSDDEIVDNWDLIQEAMDGSADAAEQLHDNLAKINVASLNISDGLKQTLQGYIDSVNLSDISMGVEITPNISGYDNIQSTIYRLAEEAKMTAEEISSYLSTAYNVKPVIKYATFTYSELTTGAVENDNGTFTVGGKTIAAADYHAAADAEFSGIIQVPYLSSDENGGIKVIKAGNYNLGSGSSSSSGSSSNKKADKQERVDYDPFQQINEQLRQQETLLERLSGMQDTLYGVDVYKNIQKQIAAMQKRNKMLEQQYEIQRKLVKQQLNQSTADGETTIKGYAATWAKSASSKSGTLNKLGIKFKAGDLVDDDGTINQTAYAKINKGYQAQENYYYKKYAAAVKSGDDDAAEEWKEKYDSWKEGHEKFNEKIEEYNELLDQQAEYVDSLQDSIISMQEAIKSASDAMKEYAEELEGFYDNQRTMNTLNENITSGNIEGLVDLTATEQAENEYKTAKNDVDSLVTKQNLVRSDGTLSNESKIDNDIFEVKQNQKNVDLANKYNLNELWQAAQNATNDTDKEKLLRIYEKALTKAQKAGYTGGSPNDLKDTTLEVYETLVNDLQDLNDKIKSLKDSNTALEEAINDSISQRIKEIDTYIELIETITDLASIIYGENEYKKKADLLQQQREANLLKLDQLRNAKTVAETEYENYKNSEQYKEGSEQDIKYLESIEDYSKQILEQDKKLVQLTQQQMENELDSKVNEVLKSAGLENITMQTALWNQSSKYKEGQYDQVEANIQLSSLQTKFKQAINATSDLSEQKQITDLMNEQLKILENKTELSEYDVKNAENQLNILKAQIALQDAQNNKTKMKLQRDASGNYSYTYTANEEDVLAKQQALLDAQSNAYETSKEQLNKMTEASYEALMQLKSDINTAFKNGATENSEVVQQLLTNYQQYTQRLTGDIKESSEDVKKYIDQIKESTLIDDSTTIGQTLGEITDIGDIGVDWTSTGETAGEEFAQSFKEELVNYFSDSKNTEAITEAFSDIFTKYKNQQDEDVNGTGTYSYINEDGTKITKTKAELEAEGIYKVNEDNTVSEKSSKYTYDVASGNYTYTYKDENDKEITSSISAEDLQAKGYTVDENNTVWQKSNFTADGSISSDVSDITQYIAKGLDEYKKNNSDFWDGINEKVDTINTNLTQIAEYGLELIQANRRINGTQVTYTDSKGNELYSTTTTYNKAPALYKNSETGEHQTSEELRELGYTVDSDTGIVTDSEGNTTNWEHQIYKNNDGTTNFNIKKSPSVASQAAGTVEEQREGTGYTNINNKLNTYDTLSKIYDSDGNIKDGYELAYISSFNSKNVADDKFYSVNNKEWISFTADGVTSAMRKGPWYFTSYSSDSKTWGLTKSNKPNATASIRVKYSTIKKLPDEEYEGKEWKYFDTGGYTGNWYDKGVDSKNGKLAVLHQKELILNAADTENILSAVDLVRQISDAAFTNINQATSNLSKTTAITNTDTIEQRVNIEATFPNVKDAREIEEALTSIADVAYQYAHRS